MLLTTRNLHMIWEFPKIRGPNKSRPQKYGSQERPANLWKQLHRNWTDGLYRVAQQPTLLCIAVELYRLVCSAVVYTKTRISPVQLAPWSAEALQETARLNPKTPSPSASQSLSGYIPLGLKQTMSLDLQRLLSPQSPNVQHLYVERMAVHVPCICRFAFKAFSLSIAQFCRQCVFFLY